MAKQKTEKNEKRDVLAALLGDLPTNSKKTLKKIVAKAGKGSVIGKGPVVSRTKVAEKTTKPKATGKREPNANYAPTMKIHVLQDRECRAGTRAEQCWVLIRKSKTVGDYLNARKKAGMEGLGGWFGNFVKNGYLSIR